MMTGAMRTGATASPRDPRARERAQAMMTMAKARAVARAARAKGRAARVAAAMAATGEEHAHDECTQTKIVLCCQKRSNSL
eukprot:symbB.v1.2.007654.t2/scaffold466.1/size200410/7